MKLYYTTRSPYARKVRVVAIEKGIDLELQPEDLKNKSAALLKHNPVGKIPTLELDSGETLTDSSLICEYLDNLKKDPPLWPDDEKLKWRLRNIDFIAKGMTEVTVSIFYEKFLHPDQPSQEFIKKQEDTIIRCLRYFDQHTGGLEKFYLSAISVACGIGYLEFRQKHLWPREDCKNLSNWYKKISARQSLQLTAPK